MDNQQSFQVSLLRKRFPYFLNNSATTICFDGVGGTQVPDTVINAITNHLANNNGNKGGIFTRSQKTDQIMDDTREIIAEFLNAPSADQIILGDNFTNLTFRMSRALKETWHPGDEIIVSMLDHDANVSPWVRAAKDAGIAVKYIDIDEETCQISPAALATLMTHKTRLVAFCGASSSVGTRPNVKSLVKIAKQHSALVYVDAVALAPHVPIDVQDWGADFVGFSAYKMFGPHIAALWGKEDLLKTLPAYKIRPAPETLPMKWLNGAQPYELAAGFKAAIEYIAFVGSQHPEYKNKFPHFSGRQLNIHAGMAAIEDYESELTWYLIQELEKQADFKIWGIKDPQQKQERLPPIAISLQGASSNGMAYFLADQGIDVWSRSAYSVSLSERLGLEISDDANAGPNRVGSFIRISLNHYNTKEEVDIIISKLNEYRSQIRT